MDRGRRHGWVWLALPLGLGLMLRLWFVFHAARIAGDTLIYGDIARNLLEHGVYGFTQDAGPPLPTLIRLPGYPLFLSVCFKVFGVERYTAVLLVQTFLDLLTCLLVSGLAGRLFGWRAEAAVLWLAALCPFTASYVAAPLTETLSLLCVAVTFYGMERWRAAGLGYGRWLWVTAAGLSYAILLRPEQGLMSAAVVPALLWMCWERGAGRWRACVPAVLAAVFVLLPLAPWGARNWRVFQVIQPLAPKNAVDPGESVPKGFQRWYRTWAIDFTSTEDVYWNYDGDRVEVADLPTRAFDTESQYARTEALFNDYDDTARDNADLNQRFAVLAEERVKANPLRYYVALPVARLVNMAFRPRTEMLPVALEWWKFGEHRGQTLFAIGFAALNLGYFGLAGVGLRRWRMGPLGWAMAGTIGLRCALLLTLDNSEPRYTLEFFPVLLVWCGAVWCCQKLDTSRGETV